MDAEPGVVAEARLHSAQEAGQGNWVSIREAEAKPAAGWVPLPIAV